MATYNLLQRKGNCLPARPKYNHIPRSDNDVYTDAPTHRTHSGDTDPEVFIEHHFVYAVEIFSLIRNIFYNSLTCSKPDLPGHQADVYNGELR